jgi:hypothetical protein
MFYSYKIPGAQPFEEHCPHARLVVQRSGMRHCLESADSIFQDRGLIDLAMEFGVSIYASLLITNMLLLASGTLYIIMHEAASAVTPFFCLRWAAACLMKSPVLWKQT